MYNSHFVAEEVQILDTNCLSDHTSRLRVSSDLVRGSHAVFRAGEIRLWDGGVEDDAGWKMDWTVRVETPREGDWPELQIP
jgi:hypothetical protein